MNKLVRLIGCVVVCEGVGIAGSVFTFKAIPEWYATLNKPFFAPPNSIFGPVWITLYLLMGVALYLAWGKKKVNLNWFWIQLGLNFAWSIIFFGLRSPLLAFGEIVFLWVSILQSIRVFKKTDKRAAYLLYPYLAWVSFAALLNLSIAILNF